MAEKTEWMCGSETYPRYCNPRKVWIRPQIGIDITQRCRRDKEREYIGIVLRSQSLDESSAPLPTTFLPEESLLGINRTMKARIVCVFILGSISAASYPASPEPDMFSICTACAASFSAMMSTSSRVEPVIEVKKPCFYAWASYPDAGIRKS